MVGVLIDRVEQKRAVRAGVSIPACGKETRGKETVKRPPQLTFAVPPPANDPVPWRDIVWHLDLVNDFQIIRSPRARTLALRAVAVAATLRGVLAARRGELVVSRYRIFSPRTSLRRCAGH